MFKFQQQAKGNLIINLAIAAVAISIAVIIIAVAVVKGYQLQITNKIIGFSNHIQITALDFNQSYQTSPISRNRSFEQKSKNNESISFIQPIVIKAGIIKHDAEVEGVILKGIDSLFNKHFIGSNLLTGLPQTDSNLIIISATLANKLNITLHDKMLVYFIDESSTVPRARKFIVSGIFDTGFEDLDASYALVNMAVLQQLMSWNAEQISGYEIGLKNKEEIAKTVSYLSDQISLQWQVQPITEIYPQLFDWLNLLDLNVVVIIALLVIVACINMSTALLILITERTQMIGLFKALGATNNLIGQVFLNLAARLILKGMLIGNLIGLVIIWTQHQFNWIKLNQNAYFLKSVPVLITPYTLLIINVGVFIMCLVVMILPTQFVSRINPTKAIKFD